MSLTGNLLYLGSVLLGVVYKDLNDLFLNNKTEAINKSRLVSTAYHLFCCH